MDYENIMARRVEDMKAGRYTHYTVHNSFWMLLETLCAASFPFPHSCFCERFIYSHDRSTKELGTTPCSFVSGNICFEFSVQCLRSVFFPTFLPQQSTIFLYMVLWFSAFSLQSFYMVVISPTFFAGYTSSNFAQFNFSYHKFLSC